GAERTCSALRRQVAYALEGVDPAALPGRDLRQDMGGGAEAIEAERPSLPRLAVAAPADQSGAHQRSDLGGVAALRKREAIARIGKRVSGAPALAAAARSDQRLPIMPPTLPASPAHP